MIFFICHALLHAAARGVVPIIVAVAVLLVFAIALFAKNPRQFDKS